MSENKNTKIVLNRQSDGILDNAKITAPVGIEKTDLPGLVDDLAGLQETDKKLLDTVKEVDANLTEAISVETARAEAVEAAISNKLEAAIEAEHQHHIDGDANLQGQIDTILDGSSVDLDQFREVVAFVESIDLENDANLLGAVADINSSVKATEEKLSEGLAKEVADREADVDAEEARAIAAEAALTADLSAEVANRIADVDAEEARAIAAEAGLTADLSAEVADREADVDAEEARAIAAESQLTSDLSAEVANRIADVDAEEARAIAAEAGLKSDINVEKGRIDTILDGSAINLDQFKEVVAFVESIDMENDAALLTAVSGINSSISIEIADRTASDAALSADLSAEVANRIADVDAEEARAKAAEVKLTSDLSAEAARAKAAEGALDAAYKSADVAMEADYKAADATLQSNINTEATERLAGEVTLQGNLDAETSRAQSAEANLSSDLAKETADRISAVSTEESRAKAAEAKLTSDLSTEESRAKAAEGVLQSNIDVETGRIDAILLASDADKDSFAEIVSLINSVDTTNDEAFAGYVVANNAALAEEVARAEQAEAGLSSDISDEKSRAMGVEADLASDLSDEKSRAMAAEASLVSDLADEKSRAMAAEAGLTADLTSEVNRAIAAEEVLTSDLSAEVSRATAVEAGLTADLSAEVANREAGDSALQASLVNETSDRLSADQALQANLDAETARATAAEAALKKDLSENISNVETELTDAIDAEVVRAIAAEAGLKKDLTENISKVETELTDAIDAEEARAIAAEAGLKKDLTENISKVEAEFSAAIEAEHQHHVDGDAKLQEQIDTILDGSSVDLDQFREVVAFVESIDMENDEALLKAVTDINSSIDAEVVRAEQAESDLSDSLSNEVERAEEAEAAIITTVGYDDMGAVASKDYSAYVKEVKQAGEISNVYPGKIQDLKDREAVLVAAMSDNIFPVTIEETEYADADSLQVAIDEVHAQVGKMMWELNISYGFLNNFGPDNIVNFESWVDYNQKVSTNESDSEIITAVGYDEMGAIASGDYDTYKNEVSSADSIKTYYPAKIQEMNDREAVLVAAMSDNIFPVTIEGNEYADVDSLQVAIDGIHAQAVKMTDQLNSSVEVLQNFGPVNIVNFESWVDFNRNLDNADADLRIIKAVGYYEMGTIASVDWSKYRSDVAHAQKDVKQMTSKIDSINGLLTSLNDAMSIGEFPVTIEGNEYVDADSLQVTIDGIPAQVVKMTDQLNSSVEFLSNFAPVNIVNFESWIDFNQNVSTQKSDAAIIAAVGYDDMGAIASGDYKAYVEEVETATKMGDVLASKIEGQDVYLTLLTDAMSIGEFPVTVESIEYTDSTSLQNDIDRISLVISNLNDELKRFGTISDNFSPINLVNFESWVDSKKGADNAENFDKVYSLIDKEVERATKAEEGLDDKIADIISNTDITSIDSFSEVVADVDFAVAIVNYNAAMYVIDNRPTMLEFNETPDGSGTTFNAPVIMGTHIVFLNGLMQFEGRDYVVGRLAAHAVASADRTTAKTAAGKTPYHADEQSLSIEFYTAPEATDVLNVYGVQTGTEMNAAMSLAEIAEAAGGNGGPGQPRNPIRREDNVKYDVLDAVNKTRDSSAPVTEAPVTEAPATVAPATDSSAEAPADATEPTV